MHRTDILVSILFSGFLLLSPLSTADQIEWERGLRQALERADSENIPVFIAVNMDGEKVSEELVENHYRHKSIVKLSKNTANLFASKYYHKGAGGKCPLAPILSCALHQQVEKDLRKQIPDLVSEDEMIAPNHIFLNPRGEVILSVPYMITPGQLEWCMYEAIRKVNPDFSWSLSSGARAPRRLIYGAVAAPGNIPESSMKAEPLSREELEEVKALINKSGRGMRNEAIQKYFPSLIVTESKEAMDCVKTWLSHRWSINRGRTAKLLHEIGRTSPPSYWSVAAPYVSHEKRDIRNEAVVALEQLAAPKSLKTLTRQLAAEKDESVRGNLYRAVASVGRGSRSAEAKVLKAAEKEKKDFLRIHAVIGLVYVENREKVLDVLLKALNCDRAPLRAAAAYTIAFRREAELKEALRIALEGEQDPKCLLYLKAAVEALEGGSLEGVQGVLTDYALDEIARDRME